MKKSLKIEVIFFTNWTKNLLNFIKTFRNFNLLFLKRKFCEFFKFFFFDKFKYLKKKWFFLNISKNNSFFLKISKKSFRNFENL